MDPHSRCSSATARSLNLIKGPQVFVVPAHQCIRSSITKSQFLIEHFIVSLVRKKRCFNLTAGITLVRFFLLEVRVSNFDIFAFTFKLLVFNVVKCNAE